MFDIGFTELVLVAVIGLLILGPERMPVAVRTIGLWVGKIKRTVSGVQKEIQDEVRLPWRGPRHEVSASIFFRRSCWASLDPSRAYTALLDSFSPQSPESHV